MSAQQETALSGSGRRLIVAIDGPAGAGKSTVASRIARRFGLLNLETGAMYRALAFKALTHKLPLDDAHALESLTTDTVIRLEPGGDGNRVLLDGQDVTTTLRQPEITEAASRVSVHPVIRRWMVEQQRSLGAEGGVVMEGRDIGTAVFPDAQVKIFLDATPEARSERRASQMGAASATQTLEEIRRRDERDRTRAESPLKPAPDAVVIDSTFLPLEEVLARIEAVVQRHLDRSL